MVMLKLLQQRIVSVFSAHRSFASDKKAMVKYLCVAEKNDAAKNIASILSGGQSTRREGLSKYNKLYCFNYQINGTPAECIMTSVSGHLLQLEFTGNFKNWQACNPVELFDAEVRRNCPEDFQNIKRTIQKELHYCQGLIIWTDCDREGENIGFEIIEVCREIKPNIQVYRAKFSEITARSIKRAVENLERPNQNVSDAVNVRIELDLRTGAAFTRLQTLRLQKVFPDILEQKVISYGSCQFPTLGFVVERFKAIENFIAEPFWQINLSHTIKALKTDFTWKRNRLFDKPTVQAIFNICRQENLARIESVESKPKSKWRPTPLDTIEMEKTISRKMRINATEIMKIAEKLYTSGLISYPRTETNIFPKELNLRDIVSEQEQDPNWGGFARRIMEEGGPTPRQGKKSDQAHPPIHPTKYTNSLSGNEKKVYDYIVRHFLACVQKDAKGHETIVQADVAEEKFTAKGLVILERNYLDVYIYENWNGKEIHEYQVGDTFIPTELRMNEGETSPPKLLTEADLIALMEKHGIGTDATHAEHIEKIKSRNYVSLQQNIYFVPAALGMGLVEGYNNMELQVSLAKPNLRSDLENDLKLICDGVKRAEDVLRDQVAKYKEVFQVVAGKMAAIDGTLQTRLNCAPRPYNEAEMTRPRDKSVMKCPKCGSDMFVKQRPNGAGWYLGCSNFPACRNAAWFAGVSAAAVMDDTCSTCGPNVRKVKITFRQNPFLGEPNPNILCIGGCDVAVLSGLDISLSTVKRVHLQPPQQNGPPANNRNQNSGFGAGGGGGGTDDNNSSARKKPPPKPKPPNQPAITSWVNGSNTSNSSNSFSTSSTTTITQNNDNTGDSQQYCHCNTPAVVFTCRNGQNAGRQFYKCPANTLAGGGCKYFSWKDDENRGPNGGAGGGGPSFNNSYGNGNNSDGDDDDGDDPQCQCGLPAVTRTVNKDGPNKGRQFRGCSKPMGQGCKFFEWTDENGNDNKRKGKFNKTDKKFKGKANTSQGGATRAKRKCGICHQEGHTRVKCPSNND